MIETNSQEALGFEVKKKNKKRGVGVNFNSSCVFCVVLDIALNLSLSFIICKTRVAQPMGLLSGLNIGAMLGQNAY